jgi:DNA mismatch repair protein MutL
MQKIRLLSDIEIQCIAAGEVIENPSNIIKELVENAIDAKASIIKIIFREGGLEEITVIDDGVGMSTEDLALALIPHATSKLVDINQLYFENNIFFGFRGEALSSIAGISKITITSRQESSPYAYSIFSDNGLLSLIEKVPGNFGTKVTVKNLFDKIPVRKKYLGSVKNQERNIFYVITGLMLSYPNISFYIYKDGSLYKEYLSCLDFLLRAYQLTIQDRNFYLPILYNDNYVNLEGLISFSEYGFYDRSRIFTLANNRLIKQYKITQSCIKAYNSENFSKKYPELFLKINVPSDQIDVNVHPRKEEVLFLYQKKIEQIITSVIINTLEARTKNILSQIFIPKEPFSSETLYNNNINFVKEKRIIVLNNNEIDNNKSILLQKNIIYENKDKNINLNYNLEEEPKIKEIISNFVPALLFEKENKMEYIGILANIYILFLSDTSIICIDQHALHEKILYEKFILNFKNINKIEKQSLLFPFSMNISEIQKNIFENEIGVLNSLGIYYKFVDLYIIITDSPDFFLNQNLIKVLNEFFILLYKNREKSFLEKQQIILHEIAALYGCKNAVKAGDKLNSDEVQNLVERAKLIDNGTFCPHGRPSYYEINIKQLDILFKRK